MESKEKIKTELSNLIHCVAKVRIEWNLLPNEIKEIINNLVVTRGWDEQDLSNRLNDISCLEDMFDEAQMELEEEYND